MLKYKFLSYIIIWILLGSIFTISTGLLNEYRLEDKQVVFTVGEVIAGVSLGPLTSVAVIFQLLHIICESNAARKLEDFMNTPIKINKGK